MLTEGTDQIPMYKRVYFIKIANNKFCLKILTKYQCKNYCPGPQRGKLANDKCLMKIPTLEISDP